MNGDRFGLGTYVIVAAAFAALAYAAGSVVPGTGVIVLIGGSLAWTAYNAVRFGKVEKNG